MKRINSLMIIMVGIIYINTAFAQQDTVLQMNFNNYMDLVKQFHPVAKQADLLIKSAAANQLIAKGNFDPKMFYDFKNKFFNSKNYYELANGGLSIPTWFGLQFKAGFETNSGYYLNPENVLPTNGVLYAQFSLPLLQGLLIDERRATLKQANLFKELSTYEKVNTLNELLLKAGKSYWDWYLAYVNKELFKDAFLISQQRLSAIKNAAILGDRPIIDTVEAAIQTQDRLLNWQQATLEYQTKTWMLSNYLWTNTSVPLLLNNTTIPAIVKAEKINNQNTNSNWQLIDSILNQHPIVKTYQLKMKQLLVEKQLKKDKFKPNLNLVYNPLYTNLNNNFNGFNNYKWGLSMSAPLLYRKERGELQLMKWKIENLALETSYKRNELTNKVKTAINEFANYSLQVANYSTNVVNYNKLWQSEIQLFESGESTLFMINSREWSYFQAQIKLNELINKKQKAFLETDFSLGLLNSK